MAAAAAGRRAAAASRAARHDAFQRRYYETNLGKPAMQPSAGASVVRHVNRIVAAAALDPHRRVLEMRAGLGEFTLVLLARGFALTANDLSPIMLERLRAAAGDRPLATLPGDVAQLPSLTAARLERAIGLFTLHHVHDVLRVLRGIRGVLTAGARVAFCEPAPWNPLCYLRIALTPGMSWRAERGIPSMRRAVVCPGLVKAGYVAPAVTTYRALPAAGDEPPLGCGARGPAGPRVVDAAVPRLPGLHGAGAGMTPFALACPRCGRRVAAPAFACAACDVRFERQPPGYWAAAREVRPAGFSDERRAHLARLEQTHFWAWP